MVTSALIITLVYYLIFVGDFLVGWQTLSRPIVAGPIIGLALGDIRTGIIMGGSLEAIFMGISAIGGSVPADALTSTIISVAYVVLTGASVESALALSLPIGAAMASFGAFMTPVHALASPFFEKVAASGNTKKFARMHVGYLLTIFPLVNCIIIFLAVAFGIGQLEAVLAVLPPFIMRGIGASAGMLPAIGFAIITSMVWTKELGAYFFVGFILSKYLGLGTVPIAMIGVIIAYVGYINDNRLIALKNELAVTENEEDFF